MEIRPKILVIDDEPDMLSGFSAILKALGYTPEAAPEAQTGIEMLRGSEYEIIFCDLQMPGMDGMQFLETAFKIAPGTPVVIFTAYGTIERAVEAMKMGAYDFLEKPIDTGKLRNVLGKCLSQRKLFKDRGTVAGTPNRYGIENIVGESEAIEKIFELVLQVAGSDSNILITGESGTGKELIARSIHAHSHRKSKPFVAVNCGAFPEQLFESEIFGYESGAFTGASRRKAGLLEYADGGVFFMDEVCELSGNLQVKMLRAIQEKCMRRLGGNELIHFDTRYISATNRDVGRLLESEKLRNDFYYRINVVNIQMPPLRERGGDIILLADYFLNRAARSAEKNITGFSPDVSDLLLNYRWPGNVRELENVIERAVTLTKNDAILTEDLPVYLRNSAGHENESGHRAGTLHETKQRLTAEAEKKYLLSLLEKHHGNITHVALEAGMSRRNIHRLIKVHNIDVRHLREG